MTWYLHQKQVEFELESRQQAGHTRGGHRHQVPVEDKSVLAGPERKRPSLPRLLLLLLGLAKR